MKTSEIFKFASLDNIKKENKKLKTAKNSLKSSLEKRENREILSEKDLKALEKALDILDDLIEEREEAAASKKKEEEVAEMKVKKGKIWFEKELGDLTTKRKLQVILADRVNTKFWCLHDIDREFEQTLEKWSLTLMKSSKDVPVIVSNFEQAINDKANSNYQLFEEKMNYWEEWAKTADKY